MCLSTDHHNVSARLERTRLKIKMPSLKIQETKRKISFKNRIQKCILWLVHCITAEWGFDCFAILLILGSFLNTWQAGIVFHPQWKDFFKEETGVQLPPELIIYVVHLTFSYVCHLYASLIMALYITKQSSPCHKFPITPDEKLAEPFEKVVSQMQISLLKSLNHQTLSV